MPRKGRVVVVVGKHGADGVVHLFRARRGAIRDREAKGASVVAGACAHLTREILAETLFLGRRHL